MSKFYRYFQMVPPSFDNISRAIDLIDEAIAISEEFDSEIGDLLFKAIALLKVQYKPAKE